jgi:hypothetical protein
MPCCARTHRQEEPAGVNGGGDKVAKPFSKSAKPAGNKPGLAYPPFFKRSDGYDRLGMDS